MVTAQQKAKELLIKFHHHTAEFDVDRCDAKQCALIFVNEMILEFASNPDIWYEERDKFWTSVRKELEKL